MDGAARNLRCPSHLINLTTEKRCFDPLSASPNTGRAAVGSDPSAVARMFDGEFTHQTQQTRLLANATTNESEMSYIRG